MLSKNSQNKYLREELLLNTSIKPGKEWLDTEGKRIEAHGGALFFENDTFYWYGENKEFTEGTNEIWTTGIKYYSSKDMYNWKNEGFLIEPNYTNVNSLLHPSFRMDRPHIIFNEKTQKYICWLKYSGKEACFVILQANSFRGPYTIIQEHYRPHDKKVGDFDIVIDENKNGHLFYDGNHEGIFYVKLSEDYTCIEGQLMMIHGGFHPPFVREAPAYFLRNGYHYLITSGMTGYTPNPSEIMIAKELSGPYELQGNPHKNDESRSSFNSQISQIFKHPKKNNLYIAIADRWLSEPIMDANKVNSIENFIASRFDKEKYQSKDNDSQTFHSIPRLEKVNTSLANYVWLPVHFDENKAYIEWIEEWKIEDYK